MSWPFGRPKQPDPRHFSGSLYCYPGYAMGRMQVGFVAIGIAQGAIDRAVTLAQTKTGVASTTTLRERPTFPIGPADAVALVRGSRAWLQDALHEFGSFVAAGEDVSYAARANRLLASTTAVHNCAKATDIHLHPVRRQRQLPTQPAATVTTRCLRRNCALRRRRQSDRIGRPHDARLRAAATTGDPELTRHARMSISVTAR